jgi:RNase P/RNase MRP subunit POP5
MKPSQRFKKRYVSFALSLDGKAQDAAAAKSMVHEHFLSFFGENGIASLAFKLVKYSPEDGVGIVRCERGRADEAIFCMSCLYDWQGKPARMEPLSTSGTIRRV